MTALYNVDVSGFDLPSAQDAGMIYFVPRAR